MRRDQGQKSMRALQADRTASAQQEASEGGLRGRRRGGEVRGPGLPAAELGFVLRMMGYQRG